jgi:hypothetical protein
MAQSERTLTPEEVINLDAYPIRDTDSAEFKALTTRLRQELETNQYVALPGFIRPAARAQAVAQIESVLPQANHNGGHRNCYLQRVGEPSLPEDHPRNILNHASTWMLAADLLPADSPLKTLYYWENMKKMVGQIVGVDVLYDNEDPMQPVNALCYRNGDQSAWHFDSTNAFTMTLMLQAPEGGGRFEMHQNTRSDDDQNYDQVRRVVMGNEEGVIEVGREADALCIFRGCNSVHRVSPVEGDRLRIMGVFVYENEPGIIGDPEVNETIYGRRTAMPVR